MRPLHLSYHQPNQSGPACEQDPKIGIRPTNPSEAGGRPGLSPVAGSGTIQAVRDQICEQGRRHVRSDLTVRRVIRSLALIIAVGGLVTYTMRRVQQREWNSVPTFTARAGFRSIGGVEVGTKIRIQGMDAGLVAAITPPSVPGKPVVLTFRIDRRLQPLVRSDTVARIVLQGVIGSKVVELVPGQPGAPALADSGVLPAENPIELADLVTEASATLKRVDLAARSAEQGMEEIRSIAASVRAGKGTLGKLTQDDEVYQKIVGMSDRSVRALDDLGENLQAIKRTWPVSRYFENKGFYDRDNVLFKPGAERASRSLAADDLFRPGGAILTDAGRRRLDEVGAWFDRAKQAKSEVVIAAFTDDGDAPDRARILTQEQADAVRNYLVAKHGINSVGWFGTRKVAAVGFGGQPPEVALVDPGVPPRRVEVILFTPKT